MQIRQMTAITVLAAMAALGGCGAEEPDSVGYDETGYEEPGYTGDDQVAAPEGSVAGTEYQTDDPATTGTSDPMTGSQPGSTGDDLAGQTGMGQPEEEVGMTEFAALDTDANGKLAESEWQPEAVAGIEGMDFEEIDEDSSGDIDREEFRQAIASSGEVSGSETQSTQPQ